MNDKVSTLPKTPMQEILEEAQKKIADERRKKASGRVEAKLREIADAEAVLKNLKHEYEVMIADIESEL